MGNVNGTLFIELKLKFNNEHVIEREMQTMIYFGVDKRILFDIIDVLHRTLKIEFRHEMKRANYARKFIHSFR